MADVEIRFARVLVAGLNGSSYLLLSCPLDGSLIAEESKALHVSWHNHMDTRPDVTYTLDPGPLHRGSEKTLGESFVDGMRRG